MSLLRAALEPNGVGHMGCLHLQGQPVPDCICHPSCGSCGFGANATTEVHCLSCLSAGKQLSPLSLDGAGHCKDGKRNISTVVHKSFIGAAFLDRLADPAQWAECKRRWIQWYDNSSAPNNVWEELVQRIWQEHPAASRAAGFEFWCNIFEDDGGDGIDGGDDGDGSRRTSAVLGWHADADVIRQLRLEIAMPEIGAVFYGFPHRVEGGILQIAPPHALPRLIPAGAADAHESPTAAPKEVAVGPAANDARECDEGCERILPEYNSLVVFDVRRLHRVGHLAAGKRYSFQVRCGWGEQEV